jgi:hypothetical protein
MSPKRRRIVSMALTIGTLTLATLAALLMIRAALVVMWQDRQQNVHDGGSLVASALFAIVGVLPYPAVARTAWVFRRQTTRSALWFTLNLLLAWPTVPLMMSVIAAGGKGDGQLGLGLLVFGTIQYMAVGVISIIAISQDAK